MSDKWRSRRQLLKASGLMATVGLAGCTGVLEEETATPPNAGNTDDISDLESTETPGEEQTQEPSEDTTDNQENQESREDNISIGISNEIDRERPEVPESPDPDWTVANDGSGDYESVGEAIRVAQEGDVIEIAAGTYDIPSEGNLQFVGTGRSETTVRVTTDSISGSDFSFYNMTVSEMPEVSGLNTELGFYNCLINTEIPPAYNSRSYLVHGVQSRFTELVDAELLDAKGCLFEGDTNPILMQVSDCRFTSGTKTFTAESLERCVFEEPVNVRLQDGEGISDTVFSGITLEIEGSRYASMITNCRFEQPPSSTEVATFRGGCDVKFSRFEGTCSPNCRFLFANEFSANGDIDFFIDGQAPIQLAANVFDGAEIRIDSVRGPVGCDIASAAYIENAEIGNYYSTFDEEDENGDNILDLPYPIPGQEELTDQYPLASDNLIDYLPVSAEYEVCGYV